MKKFNIMIFICSLLFCLLVVSCNSQSSGDREYNSLKRKVVEEIKQPEKLGGEIRDTKKSNLVSHKEVISVLAPVDLSNRDLIKDSNVYSMLKESILRYRRQLVDEIDQFQICIAEIERKIYENGGQALVDGKGNELKALVSPSHFSEVSNEFLNLALVNNIYSTLGCDVRVVNKLEEIVGSFDLDNMPDSEFKATLRQDLGRMLVTLSNITSSAIQLTNDYLNNSVINKLAQSQSEKDLKKLKNHLDEFIQNRVQFIGKIKNVILGFKIGDRQSMFTDLGAIMSDKGDIIAAVNFTQRKAELIKDMVDTLIKIIN
ncbi:hypothetical protein baBA2_000935 (plasmid) [Borrelia anserina]|uniref:hypothetical protein n=1 Tax=Borrelia anserina TaxID=143 RepID=UPI00046CC63C|nr:hypothetical protein [Borrelia anserina]UPA07309.1 hypothetical protein baBA2_000935 [Borrelia anserina]